MLSYFFFFFFFLKKRKKKGPAGGRGERRVVYVFPRCRKGRLVAENMTEEKRNARQQFQMRTGKDRASITLSVSHEKMVERNPLDRSMRTDQSRER